MINGNIKKKIENIYQQKWTENKIIWFHHFHAHTHPPTPNDMFCLRLRRTIFIKHGICDVWNIK